MDCSETEPFVLNTDQQLGRIEVFNSLAVIAPQIELDRLRSERRYNVTGIINIEKKIKYSVYCVVSIKSIFAFSR